MSDDHPKKTPLGAQPEWRWRELRVRDLVHASNNYAEDGRIVTPEDRALVAGWLEEGNRHLQWLMDHPREAAR